MQGSTHPADWTDAIDVKAFHAVDGASPPGASDCLPHAVECELVEDRGALVAHRVDRRGPPPPASFSLTAPLYAPRRD